MTRCHIYFDRYNLTKSPSPCTDLFYSLIFPGILCAKRSRLSPDFKAIWTQFHVVHLPGHLFASCIQPISNFTTKKTVKLMTDHWSNKSCLPIRTFPNTLLSHLLQKLIWRIRFLPAAYYDFKEYNNQLASFWTSRFLGKGSSAHQRTLQVIWFVPRAQTLRLLWETASWKNIQNI